MSKAYVATFTENLCYLTSNPNQSNFSFSQQPRSHHQFYSFTTLLDYFSFVFHPEAYEAIRFDLGL